MALQTFLRSALEENLCSAVASFTLGHRLVIDRLTVAHCFDQHVTGRDTLPNDLARDGIGARLRLGKNSHEVFLNRHICRAARCVTDDFNVASTPSLAENRHGIPDLSSRRGRDFRSISWKEHDRLRRASNSTCVDARSRCAEYSKICNHGSRHCRRATDAAALSTLRARHWAIEWCDGTRGDTGVRGGFLVSRDDGWGDKL